jgi:hypothetical protein
MSTWLGRGTLSAFAAAAMLALFGLSATPAEAKQCIWNKGGFVLRVDWFKVGTIIHQVAADGAVEFTFTEQPVQTDSIWSGSGRCINRGNVQYQALLSVCGGTYNSRVVSYPPEWPETNRIDCNINAIAAPSLTRYLDVWGPVWDVQSGPGGPL